MSNLELVLRFITSYSLAMLKPRPMHLEPVHYSHLRWRRRLRLLGAAIGSAITDHSLATNGESATQPYHPASISLLTVPP